MGDSVSNNAINEKQQGAVELLKGEREREREERLSRRDLKERGAKRFPALRTHMHFTSKSLKGTKEPCTNTPYLQL
jgi:hypothetical protein